jgi:type II secretion system protein H
VAKASTPTSEIGTTISSSSSSSSSARARSPDFAYANLAPPAGFTLIEMLVVVFIIGIIAAGVLLSVNLTGTDHELQTESERLATLMNYARDEAEMQTREFGLACSATGYAFYAFDPRTALWGSVTEDDALRPRILPAGSHVQIECRGPRHRLQAAQQGGPEEARHHDLLERRSLRLRAHRRARRRRPQREACGRCQGPYRNDRIAGENHVSSAPRSTQAAASRSSKCWWRSPS